MLSRIANLLSLSHGTWRWVLNGDRSIPYSLAPKSELPSDEKETLETLQRDGIVIGPAERLLTPDGAGTLETLMSNVAQRMLDEDVQAVLQQSRSADDRKDFIYHLESGSFSADSPLIRLALDPRLLRTANAYLGMRAYLKDINVWLNLPTPSSAKETQLWHQDSDDYMNIKVFIYLKPVTTRNGPFCFIPETHRIGKLKIKAAPGSDGRVNDAEMTRHLPESRWLNCVGPAGTMILADTTGWHRGLKPQDDHRVLAMIQYTSGHPLTPRTFKLTSIPSNLNVNQKSALTS